MSEAEQTALAESRGIARYRAFLAVPHTALLLTWSVVARLPIGMTPLALLLLARDQGVSYGAAGLLLASYGIAVAIGSVVAGRRVDRRGPVRVLTMRAIAYPLLLCVVIVLAVADAPFGSLIVAAAAAGFLIAPIGATVRSVWPAVVPDELRSTAYSLEAAIQEIIFVVGPLLAAGLSVIDPLLAIGAAAIAMGVGTFLVCASPPVRALRASGSEGGLLGALESRGVRLLTMYSAMIGIAFGAVEVAMPAFAESHGARELGGLALAAFAGGSLVGGFLAGAHPGGNDLERVVRFAPILGGGLLLLQAAFSIPTLCALAFVAGLPIAPTVAAVYGLIDRTAPRYALAEAFSWFGTAVGLGIASGTAVGGIAIDHIGVRAAFGLGALAALLGALLLVVRRTTLAGHGSSAGWREEDPAPAGSTL